MPTLPYLANTIRDLLTTSADLLTERPDLYVYNAEHA